MPLESIQGILLPSENMTASWGVNTLTCDWLIKMDSPLETANDVQFYLPSFGQQSEPTFTIGLSHYPGRPDLLLKQANGVREHESGRPWWLVSVTYETGQWLRDLFPGEDQGRGNVGVKKRIQENSGTAVVPKEVIVYPWDEPPTWSSSTRTVNATVFQDATGAALKHANGIPIVEGIQVPLNLEVHTFTWNVPYNTFNYNNFSSYIGAINSETVTKFKNAIAKHVLCEDISCTENYRAVNLGVPNGQSSDGTSETHHFITLTARFVIDRRNTTHGYFREAHRRVSMHTLQLVNIGTILAPIYTYLPILINGRGDVAMEPWPLNAAGLGYPYGSVNTADPLTDFAWIDPLYPRAANLNSFANTHGLIIP